VTAFLLVLFVVVIGRLFYLQVMHGKTAKEEAQQQHSIYRKLSPVRGEIKLMDKSSLETFPVATNIQQYLVYAVPQEIQNYQLAAVSLAKTLGLDEKDVLSKITDQTRKYVPLRKQLSDQEQQDIKALNLSGVYFDSESARIYPQGNLLSQTLGFVGFKGDTKAGLYGLEKYFDQQLAGTPGTLTEEKDTSGAWIFGADRELVPAVDGVNLVLTVDKTIQFKAESLLKDTVEKNSADSGSLVVVNPKTGGVLAIANYPDFNPNEYNKVAAAKDFLNEAVTGNYEPGSVFKPITMSAAIDEGKVTPDMTYNDTGEVVEADGHKIKNSDFKAHGVQTMTQVLEQSLNTGAVFVKEQMGNADFLKYVKAFGFGEKTGIELPEAKGNLDNLKGNIKVNYDTASFGQGISVTPLQLVQAFSAIANQGKMARPFVVQSKIYSDGRVENTSPQVQRQVISAKTANTVTAMMVNVVESGHGKRAAVPGYYIAGKTGTAQVPKENGLGYQDNNNIGSFIGFGPVEDPQFLMLVRVDHPRDVKFAETTAAPAFGEMAKFILDYYHIPPTRK
jgi:cell division protein FtsI/penicillin-binding protein 2